MRKNRLDRGPWSEGADHLEAWRIVKRACAVKVGQAELFDDLMQRGDRLGLSNLVGDYERRLVSGDLSIITLGVSHEGSAMITAESGVRERMKLHEILRLAWDRKMNVNQAYGIAKRFGYSHQAVRRAWPSVSGGRGRGRPSKRPEG